MKKIEEINTLVFLVDIKADSVVTGHWMMRYLSFRSRLSTDLLGYFGSRFLIRVFGRKKCTFVRTFRCFRATEPFTALATLPAFLEPPSAEAAAVFLSFGAMARSRSPIASWSGEALWG